MSPAQGNIYVAITRTGKETAHVEVPSGSTVQDTFVKAGFSPSDYNSWTITDEDGDTLRLTDRLTSSTQLICGGRVAGA